MRKRFLVDTAQYENIIERSTFYVPSVCFSGHVTIELIDAKTRKVKQYYSFPNMIPDSFLDSIGGAGFQSNGMWPEKARNYMAVGSSALGTDPSQSALISELSPRTNNDGGFSDSLGYVSGSINAPGSSGSYHWHREVRVFTETQVNGDVREVGMFDSSTGGNMLFRTLIRDETGSLITITKTSEDQLRITHELRLYPPTNNDVKSGTFVLGTTEHSYTSSALDVEQNQKWGWYLANQGQYGMLRGLGYWVPGAKTIPSASELVSVTGSAIDFNAGVNSGTSVSSASLFPYSSGTFYRDILIICEPGNSNFGPGGIKGFSIQWGTFMTDIWQVLIDPPIVKTDIQKLKMTFRASYSASTFV